jgi:hypothetical protein
MEPGVLAKKFNDELSALRRTDVAAVTADTVAPWILAARSFLGKND